MKLSNKIQAASLLPFLVIIAVYHFYGANAFSEHLREIYRNQAWGRLSQAQDDIVHYFSMVEGEFQLLSGFIEPSGEKALECDISLRAMFQHLEGLSHISLLDGEGREWKRLERHQQLNS
ncbi:MAG: hypothetical protein OEV64_10695, partial [Desulfobulbaceae bacterium]|nr:hypothetical protein [Desulfobulbaceae bacterium]